MNTYEALTRQQELCHTLLIELLAYAPPSPPPTNWPC